MSKNELFIKYGAYTWRVTAYERGPKDAPGDVIMSVKSRQSGYRTALEYALEHAHPDRQEKLARGALVCVEMGQERHVFQVDASTKVVWAWDIQYRTEVPDD